MIKIDAKVAGAGIWGSRLPSPRRVKDDVMEESVLAYSKYR